MSTVMTHFEVELPLASDASKQAAIDAFRANMVTLCPIYDIDMYKYINDGSGNVIYSGQSHFMSGYITTAQQPAALGFLNTLNASLGITVLCTVHTVTMEP